MNMNNTRARNRFEWLILISVLGVIILFGISRYIDLARESRRIGFELLAHNFTSAVAMVRVQWLLQNANGPSESRMEFGGATIYMNATGWPVATEPVEENQETNRAHYCYQLWRALLQNPEPASIENESERWGERRYHISSPKDGVCRYELVTKTRTSHFFDYLLSNGQVLITVPPYQAVSDL